MSSSSVHSPRSSTSPVNSYAHMTGNPNIQFSSPNSANNHLEIGCHPNSSISWTLSNHFWIHGEFGICYATRTLPHPWLLLSNSTLFISLIWIYPTDVDWVLLPIHLLILYCVLRVDFLLPLQRSITAGPVARESKLVSCLPASLSSCFLFPQMKSWLYYTNLALDRQFKCPQGFSVELSPVAFYHVLVYPKSKTSRYLRTYVSISRM